MRPIALGTDIIGTTEFEEKKIDGDDTFTTVTVENDKNHSSGMLNFRDGEHSGEATLEEIIEGHDDGELSDHCQIYDLASDSWLRIDSFLEKENYNGDNDDDGSAEPKDPICEEESMLEPTPKAMPSIEIEPNDDFQYIAKNDQKKPKRDETAWGKGHVQPLTTNAEGNENAETKKTTSRRKKSKHTKPPAKLMRLCTQAMIQWDMLEDGDRLMLGLSGGKDSMSLLHVLLEFQKKLPIRFEIEVSSKIVC